MEQRLALALCVLAITAYYLVKRSRQPGYVHEFVMSLRRSARHAEAVGDKRAQEWSRIADSVDEALACVLAKRPLPKEIEGRVIADIYQATSEEILSAAEIYDINGRRGHCYEALFNLVARLSRL